MTIVQMRIREDSSRLPNLCRLFEFEDDAEREFQNRSMTAAGEIYRWYHQPEVWQADLRVLWEAEAEKTGFDPRWSWKSDRGFHRWIGMEVEKAGLSIRRTQVRHLFNAEAMRQMVLSEVGTMVPTSLPDTEQAWRPAMRLYSKGFKAEVADAVRLAGEIAEERGEPISGGIMTKAVAEVWRTAPRIRDWVEQPNQTADPRSRRDHMIEVWQKTERLAELLRNQIGDDSAEWAEFLSRLKEIR